MITPETGLPAPDESSVRSSNTYVDPSYPREMDTALEKWGLDTEAKEYLPRDEVDRLAHIIQTARQEIESSPEIQEAIKQAEEAVKEDKKAPYPGSGLTRGIALTICLQALPPEHEARQAINKLVECNLKYAADQARASMNIISGDEELREQRRQRLSTFSDITQLATPRAVLADRIQAANLGLIEAAWKYVPGTVNKHGKRTTFLSLAKWHIHANLYRHKYMNEEPLMQITPSVLDYTQEQRKSFDTLPTYRRVELSNLDGLRFPAHIDDELQPIVNEIAIEDTTAEEINLILLQETIQSKLSLLSEREAIVINLRFGLEDGKPQILDEIGKTIGVTRERVRQIELKAMDKLRADPKIQSLLAYISVSRADAAEDQVLREEEASKKRPKEWRAYPGETWDEHVRLSPERLARRDKEVAANLYKIIDEHRYSAFRDPGHADARQLYPTALVEQIGNTLGKQLEAKHIAMVWRDHLRTIVGDYPVVKRESFGEKGYNEFSLDRVSQLFSRLFAEYIKSNEEVEISIPLSLDGKLNHLGAWLNGGHLIIHGNTGKYAGRAMGGTGQLTIDGNAGNYVGMDARGYASITVNGNAADFAGCQMKGGASVHITESVGDYCGYGMTAKENSVKVDGNAGSRVGYRAHYGSIDVRGTVQSIELPHNSRAEIVAGHVNRSDISLHRAEPEL